MVSPAVLVVADGRIRSIGAGDLPRGARTIDLGDMTLLPGLIDAHTHLTMDISGDWVTRSVRELPADAALRGARNARLTLSPDSPRCACRRRRFRRHFADECDRCRDGDRPPDDPVGSCDRHYRRPLRRDWLGARGERAELEGRRRRRSGRGSEGSALPDQTWRQGDQGLRHCRGALIRCDARCPAAERRGAARYRAGGKPPRAEGRRSRAWDRRHQGRRASGWLRSSTAPCSTTRLSAS